MITVTIPVVPAIAGFIAFVCALTATDCSFKNNNVGDFVGYIFCSALIGGVIYLLTYVILGLCGVFVL